MNDLIDREDAIMALRLEYPMMPMFKSLREEWAIKTEGFRKAEEVIMKLPSADAPTTTTGVIDAIREAEYRGYMKDVEDRPKGKWIYCEDDEGQDGYRCSECGFFVPWYYDYEDSNYILDYKACPHCLARMKGADDGADNI